MKKSINRKEVIATIEARLDEGVERKEILNELTALYYDEKTLTTLIASTADSQTKEKYRIINLLLFAMLCFTVVLKFLVAGLMLSELSLYLLPMAFLVPIVNVWMAAEVYRYKGYIYRLLGLFSLFSVFKSLQNIGELGSWVFADIFIALVLAALAFYLGYEMFPNYGFFGPKKDGFGNKIRRLQEI